MLSETAKLITELDLNDRMTPGLARAGSAVDAYGRKVGGLNVNYQKLQKGGVELARGMGRVGIAAGGVLAVGLGLAAKAAVDYEDAFAGVIKTVDAKELQRAGMTFKGLKADLLEMSTVIPIPATEFARLAETAGALGVKAKDIKEFARVTALMGVTTNLNADAAADAFGRIGSILGLTGKQYTELADTIVNLGNKGASTEADITETMKRFAAEAKAAGLSVKETAALASAVTSLGFAPERGGTAMGRVFANMATNISLANDKGKAFSKLVGEPISKLQKDIDQGRGLNIFMDVLKEIKTMTPTQANRALAAMGIKNASDRTIFRAMSDQLPLVNRQLKDAKDSTGALTEEANKKFDTLKSQFKLLRQNITAAGIEIGDAMLPALKRVVERLTAFVRANKSQLRGIGVEMGEMLDRINWNAVFSGVKTVVGLFKTAYDVVRQIPPEITAIGLGLFGLNKLSGGLLGSGITNIVGGLLGDVTKGALAKVPGVGKFVAQPVYVTNWPMGGLGGAAGAGGVAGGAAGGRGGRLMRGAGVVGLGMMAGSMVFGDQIEGMVGEGVSRGLGAFGNIMTGAMFGPFGVAAASILTAVSELKGISDDVGKAQVANRDAAEKVGHNSVDASKNITNMVRLMKETQGLDRELLQTFSASELGSGLKNATTALMRNLNGDNRYAIISQLMDAQKQAQEYGWKDVAEHIGTQIEKAKRWTPKPETFASAIAKGAALGVARGIGKADDEDGEGGKRTSRAMRKAQWNTSQRVTRRMEGMEERGNLRGLRIQERIFEVMKRGMMGDRHDMGALRRAIRMAEREQNRARAAGNKTLARNVGRDIQLMKAALRAEQQRTNAKLTQVVNKDTSVQVTVPVTTTVSVRDVLHQSAVTSRYGFRHV